MEKGIIREIRIENFKGIRALTLDASETLRLTTPNGTGKTSILEAVRYGLTGKAPKNMMRKGAIAGEVYITFNDPDGTTIQRQFYADKKRANKVAVNGKTCTAKEAQKIICDILGATEEKLDVLTSLNVLQELLNGNLSAFLLDFLADDFTQDEFYDLVEFTDEEKDFVKRNSLLPKNIEAQGIDDIYQNLFALRAESKKALAVSKAKIESYGEIHKPFFKTEEEMLAAEKEYTEANIAIAMAERERARYEKDLREYNAKVSKQKLLSDKAARSATEYDAEVTDDLLVLRQANLETKQNEAYKLKAIVDSNSRVIETQSRILKALDTSICPISSCLVCKTDKTEAKSDVEATIAEAQKAIDAAKPLLEDCNKTIAGYRAEILSIREQLRKNQVFLEDKRRLEDFVIGEKPEEPKPSTATADAKWKDFPIYKREFEEYAQYIAETEQYEYIQTKTRILESLTQKFKPKGEVNSAIMKHYCDVFNEVASEYTDTLKYYTARFTPENGMTLYLSKNKDEWIDFASLSTGERLIASIVVYAILNELMGTEIIMLDNVNDLDSKNADKAAELIDVLYETYKQPIIITATCNP